MVTTSRTRDLSSLVDAAVQRFVDLITTIHDDPVGGVNGDGTARVVFTGGTAGIKFLEALKHMDIDWSRVHVFFGDERNVPVTDPDSNEGQARIALLNDASIPDANVHGYGLTGAEMGEQVEQYERTLSIVAPEGFDLHLLGMGGEGHINSLFPHSAAVSETERMVVAVTDSPKSPAQRATLTLPAILRAQRVWLLVSGAEKAEAAGHVARGAQAAEWPAAGARGRQETILFIAEDAASQLY